MSCSRSSTIFIPVSRQIRQLLFLYALLALALAARASERVILAQSGQPVKLIFQGVTKPDAESMSKAFSAVLEKMTGQVPEITSLTSEGELPAASLVMRQVVDPKATDGSFQIRIESGRVEITAGAPMGLRFGFYELMERLGCRFWAWDEESIPALSTVSVDPLNISWTPPFRIHDLMNQEAMTMKNDFAHKLRSLSPLKFTANHNIQSMLRKFADANPDEVFPLVKTRDKETKAVTKEVREFNNLHYCYSAPGIGGALAEELEKEVIKRKGNVRDFIYFAGMGDWYGGYCECDRCTKIYEEEKWTNADGKTFPGLSGTLLRMVNEAAEILETKYPGIQVGTFAYMSLEAPPGKTVPRQNVSIYIPRLRHSGSTTANDPSGANRTFWLNVQRWCEIAKDRVDIWEYGANYSNFLLPYPVLFIMAENIKAYHEAGIRGLMIQGNYASMGSDAVVMNNWIWSRLMSDPSLDTDKLVQEFTDGYYGPAAPEVREYLKELDASLKAPGCPNIDEFSRALETYLTPDVLKKLNARIAAARESVSAPQHAVFLTRINDLAMGVDTARLWKEGPFREKDGRYIRTDFGYDTFPEALQLWKNNRRGTAPTEMSSGKVKWLEFLSMHGGPVTTLREGELSAKIWPAKAGTIGPIMLGHVPVITRTRDDALRYAEFEGSPAEKSARIWGEGGIGGWDPDTKYIIKKEISLPDANSIRVEFFDQRVTKSKNWSSAPHAIYTTYPAKVTSKDIEFAYRDKAGTWHDVDTLPVKGKEILLPEVAAWRVTQPKAIVTDEFEGIKSVEGTPPINLKRPHLSGRLGVDAEGNFYTVSNIQVDETSYDEQVHGLSRIIKIQGR